MEAANDHVLEAVALYACPVFDLVRGDVLHIAGHVVRGVGVGALGTYRRHELVILVGYVILCRDLRHAVYLVVEPLALGGVGHLAVGLVAAFNVVEVGQLLLVV